MSNKQIFQVYHGPENVRYGPTGVDLLEFIVSKRGIDKLAERSVPSIKGWLMRGLRVDPQTSDITINVIDPGVQMNMDDGEGPSAEVNETSVEEVNAREDGGVVAPVGIQLGGVADEGETVGAIVDEMEREDSDNERVEKGDSSDDETDINPAEWASEDFSSLVVSEEDSVRWEYKENEVIQGAIYTRAEDMKEAVKHFAVSLHREFWVAKFNRSQYEVRNITCAFVASEMYAHVIDNLTYEPRSIIQQIEETYKYTISYAKAYRAKQKIIEMRFATYEASYDNLPRLLGVIEERNPGSSYTVKKFPSIEHPSKSVLQRAFLALHACKMALVNCRPVLCIDGTFLTGKYFRDRFQAVLPSMPNNSILFRTFMQKKLEELRKKAMKHRALVQGTQQHKFEILCQDKAGRGIYRKRVKQECVLKADGTCHCSCAKPKLLHRPCTHVIAAAAECGIPDAVYVSRYFKMARQDTPELLDPAIDHRHRSHLTMVQGAQLGTFRARTCGELHTVHDSFVERLREAGLLPMCRLVEAAAGDADPARRWNVDRSLLAALVDRWRPEAHTFHLPCGEVAPTLQDVSYLLRLPLAGDAIGPVTTCVDWKDDLTARFAPVQRAPHLPLQPLAHHRNTGPTRRWLLQFTLFGWVMFCGGHGHAVDKGLVHYARSIADTAVGEVPQWSWGSALLAALYRGLCEACTKTDPSATFGGCPLFLSIWVAERIAIGCPEVDQHAYGESLYVERPEVDYPTMGTLWCRRQVRRSYPEFVMEFDRLLPTNVVWEPYSAAATQARAPLGLSTLCTRDQAYWMTTVPMVFDICVEPHAPFRVMWQFGFRQLFPVPFPMTVPAAVHR
uniref:SWIM zinc finger family protein n=1 Tax=Oryza sativa subsp. japonica TaxID=39947 RepID=Q2R381_ORYSJ|nr:SWIM zinc finger family protein [Oryza sativa Japonica Group]